MSEEGEDNWKLHQRMEEETGAMTEMRDNPQQDLQEDHAGGHKANGRDFH
jgi:hypothetical protein